jgi:3-oxoadipate enol-lactonase
MQQKANRTGTLEVNGAQLYYEEWGAGPALVLVHAGIADGRMWDDQMPVFAQHYRVIRFDQRGFGRSAPASGTFARHEDLRALLAALEIERAHLVGCSMGGKMLIDFVLSYPAVAASLSLVCTGPYAFQYDAPRPRQADALNAAYEAGDVERASWLEIELWVDGPQRTPDQVPAAIREKVYQMNLQAIRNELSAEADEQILEPHAVDRLGEIQTPTLVIIGDLDNPAAVAGATFTAASIPGAQKAVMTGTAHLPNLERPDEFNQILTDFLARQRA